MKRLLIIPICLTMLIGGLYFYNSTSLGSKNSSRVRSSPGPMNESTEAVISRFEQHLIHDDPPIFSEPIEVLDHLSGDLKEGFIYPDEAVIKNLIGIYIMPVVERDDPNYGISPPEVHMYFNYGPKPRSLTSFDPRETIFIEMHVDATKMDPDEMVERDNSERRSGYSDSDVDTTVIDINGTKGYARPPGYKGFGNDKIPRAGFIRWQQGNVVYMVYGLNREPGTDLDTLAAIARSMKPVKKN